MIGSQYHFHYSSITEIVQQGRNANAKMDLWGSVGKWGRSTGPDVIYAAMVMHLSFGYIHFFIPPSTDL